jgi:hypothetical protein
VAIGKVTACADATAKLTFLIAAVGVAGDRECTGDRPGSQHCPGYTEIYGFFRSTLGWSQLSGTKAFSIGR